MRRTEESSGVPDRARPTSARAAAAARLAGVADTDEAVAERMRQAARRARTAGPVTAPTVAGAAALAVVEDPVPRTAPGKAPRPRHLTVVKQAVRSPAQRRRRARAALVAGVGAATMIGLALVYLHVVLAQRQFAIDHMDRQLQQAQAVYEQGRLQVAELGSPEHIVSTAEGQLGMVQPSNVTYLTPTATTGSAVGREATNGLSDNAGPAPAGDADWPRIKPQLAGIP